MREILFRGKLCHSNEWVMGNLIIAQNGQPYIIPNNVFEQDGHHLIIDSDNPFWVFPETVGQFTGLTDKNGVKIFEGKISLEIVGCGIGAAEILIHEGQWQIYEQSQGYYPLFKAIGNDSIIIHDNPELLTK